MKGEIKTGEPGDLRTSQMRVENQQFQPTYDGGPHGWKGVILPLRQPCSCQNGKEQPKDGKVYEDQK